MFDRKYQVYVVSAGMDIPARLVERLTPNRDRQNCV